MHSLLCIYVVLDIGQGAINGFPSPFLTDWLLLYD